MISEGKKRGFGFVQFARLEEASTALKDMNMKAIKGKLKILLINY